MTTIKTTFNTTGTYESYIWKVLNIGILWPDFLVLVEEC